MNSYNNIVKMKYNSNNDDVVSLVEYIIFEDSLEQSKYIVFKFINNLNQALKEIRVDVAFLDEEDNVLGKSIIEYGDFNAYEHESFIPSAKLPCDFATKKIHVKLLYARFANVVFENDNFREINTKVDHIDVKAKKAEPGTTVVKASKPSYSKKESKENGKKAKVRKLKAGYTVTNIYKRNFVKFPKFINTLLVIASIAGSGYVAYNFATTNTIVSDENFDYKLVGDKYTIINYDGKEDEVAIPAKFNGKTVSTVAKNAFRFSSVKKVSYTSANEISISSGAFTCCYNLEEINIKYGVFNSNSIKNCFKLKKIDCEFAKFSTNAIKGSRKLDYFALGYVNSTSTTKSLSDIFNTSRKIEITELHVNQETNGIQSKYLDGVSVEKLFTPNGQTFAYEVLCNTKYVNGTSVKCNGSIAYDDKNNVVLAVNYASEDLIIPSEIKTFDPELINAESSSTIKTLTYKGTNNIISNELLTKLPSVTEIHAENSKSLSGYIYSGDYKLYINGSTQADFENIRGSIDHFSQIIIEEGTIGPSMFSGCAIKNLTISKEAVTSNSSFNGLSVSNDLIVYNKSESKTFNNSFGVPNYVENLYIKNGGSDTCCSSYMNGISAINIYFDDEIINIKPGLVTNSNITRKIVLGKNSVITSSTATGIISGCNYINELEVSIKGYAKTIADFFGGSIPSSLNSLTIYNSYSSLDKNDNETNVFISGEYSCNIKTLNIYGSATPTIKLRGLTKVTIGVSDVGESLTELFAYPTITNASNPSLSDAEVIFDNESIGIARAYFSGWTNSSINKLTFKNCVNVNENAFDDFGGSVFTIDYYTSCNLSSSSISTLKAHTYSFNRINDTTE